MMTTPVLSVENLSVSYRVQNRWLDAVRDVSLTIAPAQTYGLVGESGSGKSTVVQAVMRYLSSNGSVRNGAIYLDGENLLGKTDRQMLSVWGARMSMVPQDPLTALNPSLTVGEQIAEISKLHDKLTSGQARARAAEMLHRVKIADASDVMRRYPHQLSGGMQQRILIAMALTSSTPRLLILDEPTTSLDVTTEATILDLFDELREQHDAATLFVTHNLGVVARICSRVAVLYAGELMEDAAVRDLFERPLHPYTMLLLQAGPRLDKKQATLSAIPGQIPSLNNIPAGCVFAPRCPFALEICHHVKPSVEQAATDRSVKCHRWREIADGLLSLPTGEALTRSEATARQAEPLLETRDVHVQFQSGSLWDSLIKHESRNVKAVDGISIDVPRGKTVGLVGESGSGKTSFARSVVGLVEIASGEARLLDMPLRGRPRQRAKSILKRLQMVFQHPEESLNPYHTIGLTLHRPLRTLAGMNSRDADRKVEDLLRAVNLPPDYAQRYPRELSGGEKQRVAIARAFAAQPDLIVCDEPVSSLDVSVQAAVLNLLHRLQTEFNAAYLFISHDLAVVGHLADVIAVMYLGQLVEIGDAASFFQPPYHPYTEALLSSVSVPDPAQAKVVQRKRIHLQGEMPSARDIPTGCRFHTRCPRFLGEICVNQEPPWHVDDAGWQYRCHIPPEELTRLQSEAQGQDAH
jgi:peptide/nickel transport system ATP-binding protein